MKRIDVTCGYREEYDNGEILYYYGKSGEGYCYKDMDALYSGDGIAYIREACFDSGKDYVSGYKTKDGVINLDCDGLFTRAEMFRWAKDYFRSYDNIDEKAYAFNQFISHVIECIVDELEWQGFDMLLDDWDWDEDLERYAYHLYTVWVGGGEVSENLLTKKEAEGIADEWRENGYDDVIVKRI